MRVPRAAENPVLTLVIPTMAHRLAVSGNSRWHTHHGCLMTNTLPPPMLLSPVPSLPVSLPLLGQVGGLLHVARGCIFRCLGPTGMPSVLPPCQHTPSSSIGSGLSGCFLLSRCCLRLGAPEGREPRVVPVCIFGLSRALC